VYVYEIEIVSLRRGKTDASPTSPGSAFCGGTLIQNTYVVTAAHCFASVQLSQLPNYFVVVGAQYRNDTDPVRFTIKTATVHENYNSDTYDNDIALLQLNSPVDFSDPNIGFICLPPNNVASYPNASMNGTAIGWGNLQQNGSASYSLQQVQLPIISYQNKYCANMVDNDSLQFCAGFIQGGKDTCQGDRYSKEYIYLNMIVSNLLNILVVDH
jgi:secreted trypsin-like serine protease